MALTACSSISEHPEWFDAIHRTPIHRAVVDGHRIAYTDRGDGPPVILVHGFAGSHVGNGNISTRLQPLSA